MIRDFILNVNLPGKNFIQKLGEMALATYTCSMGLIYVYQFLFRNHFKNLIRSFRSVLRQSHSNGFQLDKQNHHHHNSNSYPIFCWVLTVLCMLLGITEDLLYDWQLVENKEGDNNPSNDSGNYSYNASYIYNYFLYNFGHWQDLISYNPVFTVTLGIITKIGIWGWLFTDTIVMVLCHAISKQFQALNQAMKLKLEPSQKFERKGAHSDKEILSVMKMKMKIEQMRLNEKNEEELEKLMDHFWLLAKLTKETENYVGPLIIACYSCLLPFLIILFAWIGPNISVSLSSSNSSHVYYSSFYYIFRCGIVTFFASQVYHSSQAILETLEEGKAYSQNIFEV